MRSGGADGKRGNWKRQLKSNNPYLRKWNEIEDYLCASAGGGSGWFRGGNLEMRQLFNLDKAGRFYAVQVVQLFDGCGDGGFHAGYVQGDDD